MDENLTYEKNALIDQLEDLDMYIDRESRFLSGLYEDYKEKIKEASKEAKRDDVVEAIGIANKLMSRKAFSERKDFIQKLQKITHSPYFSRINLSDLYGSKTYYIGKVGFPGYTKKKEITDWRSPIASIYYNYPFAQDNVTYETTAYNSLDQDRTHTCDLKLRRTIDIEDREILNMYEDDLISNVNTENKFLISKLGGKSGGGLEDIIETIQQDQNKILRHSPFQNTIIQGVAGSGKTTIAIHRISYIFYNYKTRILPTETLFISNSKVLINYLSKSLPELDIYSIKKCSTLELFKELLDLNELKLSTKIEAYDNQEDNPVFENTNKLIVEIDAYVHASKQELKAKIKQVAKELTDFNYYDVDLTLSRFSERPGYEALFTIIEDLKEINDQLKEEVKNKEFNLYQTESRNRTIAKVSIAIKQFSKILKEVNVETSYKNILKTIFKTTPSWFDVNHITSIYYLAFRLGLIRNKFDFNFVLIDEAQDLNEITLLAIKTLSSKNCFNFFGDMNQAITKKTSIKSWDSIKELFPKESTALFELNISYRSTRQIITKAVEMLKSEGISKYLPIPVSRDGKEPIEASFDTQEDAMDKIAQTINEIRNEDRKSIAIIITDDIDQEKLKVILEKQNIKAELITPFFDNFKKDGEFVVPLKLVKGLEFDTIFVLNWNASEFTEKVQGPYLRFVSITRAISRLYLFSIN